MTLVKICGLSTPETVTASIENGADMLGFVFHPSSPRNVSPEVAAYLASYVPDHIKVCGLLVDPDDRILETVLSGVRINVIQLHGHETPERVRFIRTQTGRQIIKALPVTNPADLAQADHFAPFSDWILLDARTDGIEFGGGGKTFDWSILEGYRPNFQWLLAGGLTPSNVADAIRRTTPDGVDVSSGIEIRRGEKDVGLICDFLTQVHMADAGRQS